MRLSSLCLAAVLIFSPAAFTQHSSGGGASSGGSSGGGSHSSSSGGGGSHSSSSGGSSSSASNHSSGGSVSRGGTASHGSTVRASNSGAPSSNSNVRKSHSNALRSIREPNAGVRARSEASGKKNFFSFMGHPFRKSPPKPAPKLKPVADLRRRICFKGPCHFCPTGQVAARGGCVGIPLPNHRHNFCSQSEIWNGNACLLQVRFLDDCSRLRLAMERQAQRIQAAEAAQQSACASGPGQQCSDLSSTAQSEGSLYRSWQDRYNRCRQQLLTAYPFNGPGIWSYSPGLLFDPLEMNLDYP